MCNSHLSTLHSFEKAVHVLERLEISTHVVAFKRPHNALPQATLSIFYGQRILTGIFLPCRRKKINKISLLSDVRENGLIFPLRHSKKHPYWSSSTKEYTESGLSKIHCNCNWLNLINISEIRDLYEDVRASIHHTL